MEKTIINLNNKTEITSQSEMSLEIKEKKKMIFQEKEEEEEEE